jgi:hypothetical protein
VGFDSKRLDRLEAEIMKRKLADNLMFARIREELDTIANKNKEDRVVLSGLTSKQPIPVDQAAKVERLKSIAMETFKYLIPDFAGKISFVSQGKGQGLMLPMLEVRLEKEESAVAIRKSFAEKNKQRKLSGDYVKLFVTNSVNLATRVRIDILKVIAKKVTNDEVQAYVVGFISRPIMHLRKKTDRRDTKPHKSYTFVDAIESYGQLIYASDLEKAYVRAGVAFKGQMQQNFVVLHEEKITGRASDEGGRGANSGQTWRGRGSWTPRGGRGRLGGAAGYTRTNPAKRRAEDHADDEGRNGKQSKQ